MIKKSAWMAGVSAIALTMGAEMAAAQIVDVRERPRPEYDAVGVRAGSFLIYPEAVVRETYNNNIYATENNTTDDWITVIRPEVKAESDWNNHALNFNAFAAGGIYADHSDEDYFDYGIGGDGRLDITRAANLFGGASFKHLHEDRGSPNAVNGVEPTEFNDIQANAGATYKPNRLGVTAEGSWRQLDFDDVNTSTGAVINNDDRDRNVYRERLRVGYDVQPGYTAFVQGSLNQRDYDITPDDNGFNRNSDGWRTDVGMEIRLTDVLDAEVYGGYFEQDYDDPRFSDLSDWDAGGRLLWAPTPLTTVRASLAREVAETVTAGASSFVATIALLGVDYELRRNVIIGAEGGFTNNDYQDITREDDIWRIGVSGTYLINRNFFAGARAHYTDRDSSVANQSYDQFTVGAYVGAQF